MRQKLSSPTAKNLEKSTGTVGWEKENALGLRLNVGWLCVTIKRKFHEYAAVLRFLSEESYSTSRRLILSVN
jgi:hypothetical protein